MYVQDNLEKINESIHQICSKTERRPEDITIIAVTKYVTIERAKEVISAGIKDLGENRLEGFQEKFNEIGEKVTWHFIGSLQSRKVKELAANINVLHSLDRKSLAKELNKRLEKTLPCFVQVNTSGEEAKHGLAPEEVIPFIEDIAQFEKLNVIGLMTMAPLTEDENIIRNSFRNLRELRNLVKEKNWPHAPCEYLSMGMSNDYPIAIEEGATHLRIGSELVGEKRRGGA